MTNINSLAIGKHIYQLLYDDIQVSNIVGNGIYPIVADSGAKSPFIAYRRTALIPSLTKDILLENTITFEIVCVANTYSQSIDLANAVTNVLDNHRFMELGIRMINLSAAYEDYMDDSFVQTLSFTFTINK